ncbi:MAG: tetratricopeptide repeat protein [Planctomycetes bacterium]|nr:tetratricopeptide repeat protein [Planctomycetota bacterium]
MHAIRSEAVPPAVGAALVLALVLVVAVPAGTQSDTAPLDPDRLYAEGKFREALDAYRARIAAGPEQIAPYCGAGKCLIALNRLTEATDLLGKAVRLPGADAEAFSVLGQAWYWDGCSILANPDDPRADYAKVILWDAENNLKRAIEKDAGLHLAHYFLGRVRLVVDRAEEAAAALGRAVELAPSETSYHFALGEALEASGQDLAAAEAYFAAARHAPERFVAYIRKARLGAAGCFARAGARARAAAEFKAAFVEDPGDIALFQRVWAILGADPGRRLEGVAVLEELERAVPGAALPGYYLGYLQLARADRAAARQAFERVVATEQGARFAGVWAMLGTLHYVEADDPETAERHLLKALELEPANEVAYTTLTHMVTYWLQKKRNTERAIELTRKILRYQPDNGHQWGILAAFHYNRSLRQDETEPSPEALEYYARAEHHAPHDPNIQCGLAKLYNAAKQYEKSEKHFQQALALDPFHLEALLDYGYMCKDTGQFAKAKALWERFLEASPGTHRLHGRVLIDLETVTRALESK